MPSSTTNSTYIYRMGTAPNTRVVVSQKSKIYGYSVGAAAFQQIGVVSEFGFDESRTIDPVRGVGFGDMVAELVPGVTEPMTLTLNRSLMYTANLFQTLGYKGGIDGLVRSLRHHRWPFDIKQEIVFSELAQQFDTATGQTGYKNATPSPTDNQRDYATSKALFTFFEGCWLNSYSASFTSDAAIVAENSSVTVTDIIDGYSTYGEFIDSGLAPTSGAPGAGYSIRFAGGSTDGGLNAATGLVT